MSRSDRTPKTFNDAFKLLLGINYLLGLRTFKIPPKQLKHIVQGLFIVLLQIFYFVGFLNSYEEHSFKIPTNIHRFGFELIRYIFLCCTPIYTITGFLYSNMYFDHFTRIVLIDETLQMMHIYKEDFRKTIARKICGIVLISGFVTFTFIQEVKIMRISRSKLHLLYTDVPFINSIAMAWCICIDFVLHIECLNFRLTRINKSLSKCNNLLIKNKLIRRGSAWLTPNREKRFRTKIIRIVQLNRLIHLELHNRMKTLCKIFGIPIAVQLFQHAIMIIINVHSFYIIFRNGDFPSEAKQLQIIATLVMSALTMIIISYVAQKLNREAIKTKEILHSFNSDSRDIKKEIRMFSLQTMMLPYRIILINSLSPGYEFFKAMCSATISYTFIAVQMEN